MFIDLSILSNLGNCEKKEGIILNNLSKDDLMISVYEQSDHDLGQGRSFLFQQGIRLASNSLHSFSLGLILPIQRGKLKVRRSKPTSFIG